MSVPHSVESESTSASPQPPTVRLLVAPSVTGGRGSPSATAMRRHAPSNERISSRVVRAWRTPLLTSSVTKRLTVSSRPDRPHSASADSATRRASAALAATAGRFVRDSMPGVYPDRAGAYQILPHVVHRRIDWGRQRRDLGKEARSAAIVDESDLLVGWMGDGDRFGHWYLPKTDVEPRDHRRPNGSGDRTKGEKSVVEPGLQVHMSSRHPIGPDRLPC